MGEDVCRSGKKKADALRSMSNPEQFGQPAHMKDYVFTEKDNGAYIRILEFQIKQLIT